MIDQDELTYVHRLQHVPKELDAATQETAWEKVTQGLAELGVGVDSSNRLHLLGENRFRHKNSMVRVFDSNATIITTTTDTPTAVTFDSESYDTDGLHSTSSETSKLVAAIPGKYSVFGTVQFALNTAGVRGCYIYKNGSIYSVLQFVPAIQATFGNIVLAFDVVDLAATEYVELMAYQDSGGDLAVLGGSGANTHFGMHYIGE